MHLIYTNHTLGTSYELRSDTTPQDIRDLMDTLYGVIPIFDHGQIWSIKEGV